MCCLSRENNLSIFFQSQFEHFICIWKQKHELIKGICWDALVQHKVPYSLNHPFLLKGPDSCLTQCRSFLCSGSTGLYVYAYCLYYYYALSDMSGFMQTSFFFGYMACICYGFFLMLGMVGFCTALSHLPIHQVCVPYQYQIKFEECYCKNQLVKSGSSLRQGVMAAWTDWACCFKNRLQGTNHRAILSVPSLGSLCLSHLDFLEDSFLLMQQHG